MSVFTANRTFITAFTRACHLSVSRDTEIRSRPNYPKSCNTLQDLSASVTITDNNYAYRRFTEEIKSSLNWSPVYGRLPSVNISRIYDVTNPYRLHFEGKVMTQ